MLGSVTVAVPDTGINSALSPRDVRIVEEPGLNRDPCDVAAQGEQSTLFIRSRRGHGFDPGTYLHLGPEYGSSAVQPGAGDCR